MRTMGGRTNRGLGYFKHFNMLQVYLMDLKLIESLNQMLILKSPHANGN